MTDTMLPILRQLYDADGDRARADILLRMPDSVLLKYRGAIVECCRRACFEIGLGLIEFRTALLLSVRGADGLPPHELASKADQYRAAVSRFVNGSTS